MINDEARGAPRPANAEALGLGLGDRRCHSTLRLGLGAVNGVAGFEEGLVEVAAGLEAVEDAEGLWAFEEVGDVAAVEIDPQGGHHDGV